MELSVLIPSIAARTKQAAALVDKLTAQATGKPAEVIMLTDNRTVPLHVKRTTLLGLSTGRFVAHLDDDDDVSDDYVDAILEAATRSPDVICFDQLADLGDGMPFRVATSLFFENQEPTFIDGRRVDIRRKPWHWCAWSGALARATPFTSSQYGEDWMWLHEMLRKCRTESRIPKVLHLYRFTKGGTAF